MQVGYRPQLRMSMPTGSGQQAQGGHPPPASGMTPAMNSFSMQHPPPMGIPPTNMMVPPPNLASMPPPSAMMPMQPAPLSSSSINIAQLTPQQQQMMLGIGEMGFDGKMLRKTVARKTVDHNPSVVKYLEDRVWKKDFTDDRSLQADSLYTQLLTLPHHMLDNPVSCVMTKFIRAALNKDPRPVFCVCVSSD